MVVGVGQGVAPRAPAVEDRRDGVERRAADRGGLGVPGRLAGQRPEVREAAGVDPVASLGQRGQGQLVEDDEDDRGAARALRPARRAPRRPGARGVRPARRAERRRGRRPERSPAPWPASAWPAAARRRRPRAPRGRARRSGPGRRRGRGRGRRPGRARSRRARRSASRATRRRPRDAPGRPAPRGPRARARAAATARGRARRRRRRCSRARRRTARRFRAGRARGRPRPATRRPKDATRPASPASASRAGLAPRGQQTEAEAEDEQRGERRERALAPRALAAAERGERREQDRAVPSIARRGWRWVSPSATRGPRRRADVAGLRRGRAPGRSRTGRRRPGARAPTPPTRFSARVRSRRREHPANARRGKMPVP